MAKIDNILAASAAKGDREAEEYLIKKYTKMVCLKCQPYYVIGGDKEDLIQEGMIGLLEAIRNFSPEKNLLFGRFAELCITRQVLTAVKAGSRFKHAPLNNSISFDYEYGIDGSETMLDILPDQAAVDPEERFILEEERQHLHESVNSLLTWQEQAVFTAYMFGYSYEAIADEMSLSIKAVDNSLQRVKRKIRQKEAWRL